MEKTKAVILLLVGICIAFLFTTIKLQVENDNLKKEVTRLSKENVILRDENTELKWEIEQIDYIVCTYEGVIVYE